MGKEKFKIERGKRAFSVDTHIHFSYTQNVQKVHWKKGIAECAEKAGVKGVKEGKEETVPENK
jgi:hypothetical protein